MSTSSKNKKLMAWLVTAIISLPLIIWAYPSNPPLGKTGAPGSPDNGATCTACHSASAAGAGSVTITSSSGTTYHPGTKQRLTVTIANSKAKYWGYEMTAVKALSPYPGKGKFTTVSGNTLSSVRLGSNSRYYAAQAKDQAGKALKVTYLIDWTPPTTNVGNITLYVAGVASTSALGTKSSSTYKNHLTLTPH